MYYFYLIISVALSFFVLKLIRVWSYNIVFMVFKLPNIWILLMTGIGILASYISTFFIKDKIGADVLLWSVILVHIDGLYQLRQARSNLSMVERATYDFQVQEMYKDLELPHGQKQYKIGLWASFIGALIAYVSFYLETTSVQP